MRSLKCTRYVKGVWLVTPNTVQGGGGSTWITFRHLKHGVSQTFSPGLHVWEKFIWGSLEKGKKNKKKIDMSEGQCALEKIIMLIITLTGKKKEQKKKTKIYCWQKKNYKNSDIPHCSHNCNKTNQHIVILLENLSSLKFFPCLTGFFQGTPFHETGTRGKHPGKLRPCI